MMGPVTAAHPTRVTATLQSMPSSLCTSTVLHCPVRSRWSSISARSPSSARRTPRPTPSTSTTSANSPRTPAQSHCRHDLWSAFNLLPSLTLLRVVSFSFFEPFLDAPPPGAGGGGWRESLAQLSTLRRLLQKAYNLGGGLMDFHEVMTAPADKILSRWFESEPLKSTLATDAIIGAMTSPQSAQPTSLSGSIISTPPVLTCVVCV